MAPVVETRDGRTMAPVVEMRDGRHAEPVPVMGTREARRTELAKERARAMAALEAPLANLGALTAAVDRLRELIAQKQAGGPIQAAPQVPSFATSEFRQLYTAQAPVEYQHELFAAVQGLLRGYAGLVGEPQAHADELFKELQAQAFNCHLWDALMNDVEKIGVALWTSSKVVGLRKEFCSILNHVLREDSHEVLPHAVVLCRAMASLVVTRRNGTSTARWPPDLVSHRGSCMPLEAVNFFTVGLLYRTPMFLATSFYTSKPMEFMQNATGNMLPVHFKFRLDPEKKCDHALYIENLTLCAGEHELLYAPYSAFKVLSVTKPDGPITWDNPIVIELLVQPNNKTVSETVPLAAWH